MKLYLAKPLYSATDLLNFLGCSHSTALDLKVMTGSLSAAKSPDDAYLEILKENGLDHERAYFERLKSEGKSSIEIERHETTTIEEMAERTRQAMRDGIDVIYQGAHRPGLARVLGLPPQSRHPIRPRPLIIRSRRHQARPHRKAHAHCAALPLFGDHRTRTRHPSRARSRRTRRRNRVQGRLHDYLIHPPCIRKLRAHVPPLFKVKG